MKSIIIKITFGLLVLVSLSACEEVVTPTLEDADPIYVVDAWINNKPEPQVIKLMRTQPYFEETLPPGVSGATITVTDSEGKVYTFTEEDEKGTYLWRPVGSEVFGETGLTYTLSISVGGETIQSSTGMRDVPPVDSITFNMQKGNSFVDDLYFAEFWATDLEPMDDTYWIRTYKNGELLNLPGDINLAYDAAFLGSEFTGVMFISPIRTSINAFDEADDGSILSPYVLGDSLYVEINSISRPAFDFLNEVIIQTDRPGGFGELFSTPLANMPTNLKNINPTGTKVVGFFNVAAASGLGRKFKSLDEISRVY